MGEARTRSEKLGAGNGRLFLMVAGYRVFGAVFRVSRVLRVFRVFNAVSGFAHLQITS